MVSVVDQLESVSDEDRAYAGSRFADVVDALFANPYQRVWGAKGEAGRLGRLRVASTQPRIAGADLDFRDEVMAQIFERGDRVPKRMLTFTIETTDQGTISGPAFRIRRTFTNWRAVGSIVFANAVVSHNGDAVLHVNHPTWRADRNDPTTATRVDGRKVVT